jgi:hypothetical protein
MSRSQLADVPATTVGQRRGRHRIDRSSGVRCTDLPAVRDRLQQRQRTGAAMSFLRALFPAAPAGRHTWDFLTNAGGRPRSAFAIILSL